MYSRSVFGRRETSISLSSACGTGERFVKFSFIMKCPLLGNRNGPQCMTDNRLEGKPLRDRNLRERPFRHGTIIPQIHQGRGRFFEEPSLGARGRARAVFGEKVF